MKLHAVCLLCQFVVVGCSTAGDGPAGSGGDEGQVAMTRDVYQGYQLYLQKQRPLVFAVGDDGRGYGFSFCDQANCRPTAQAEPVAIAACEGHYNGGVKCVVFARGRREVRRYVIIG